MRSPWELAPPRQARAFHHPQRVSTRFLLKFFVEPVIRDAVVRA
jgi:hypothetical protein